MYVCTHSGCLKAFSAPPSIHTTSITTAQPETGYWTLCEQLKLSTRSFPSILLQFMEHLSGSGIRTCVKITLRAAASGGRRDSLYIRKMIILPVVVMDLNSVIRGDNWRTLETWIASCATRVDQPLLAFLKPGATEASIPCIRPSRRSNCLRCCRQQICFYQIQMDFLQDYVRPFSTETF